MKEKITTTEAKTKEIRPKTEKFITIAKKQNLSALRTLLRYLPKQSAQKIYYQIAPRYFERKGGYVKIVKTPIRRKQDGSKMAIIEFV